MVVRASHVAFALLVLGSSVGFGIVAADSTSDPTIKATSSIDTPNRTISIQGTNYPVSSLGSINEGETLNAEISRPGNQIFTAYLYNTDRQPEDAIRRTNNGTYSFDTESLNSGTYVLALDVNGVDGFQDIQPVVISGHNFDVDVPETVSKGDSISVTASVTDDPQQVDVVLFNESWERTTTAARIGDGEYNAVIDADLAPGEYSLYVGTRGDETIDGERVLTGVSSSYTVEVEGNTDPTTSQSPDQTTQAEGSTTASTTSANSASTATTSIGTSTQTVVNETTMPNSTTPPSTITVTGTSDETENSTASMTNVNGTTDSVITPNTPSQDESTTETTTPGFTAITAILAGLVLVWRQR